MRYEFYYWPIQGRGEFVRLALEESGADYVDVVRDTDDGMREMNALLNGKQAQLPFAPPFLKADGQIVSQSANILLFLGPRLDLVPDDEASRIFAHGLQLTIADVVTEAHDTHHPIASRLYYEDQKTPAKARSADVIDYRLPKFFGYFERVLANNPHGHKYLVGSRLSYVDLSMFQLIEGLRYAFPKGMGHFDRDFPKLAALHAAVAKRPRIRDYVASKRRYAFSRNGIFRHYPELDRPRHAAEPDSDD